MLPAALSIPASLSGRHLALALLAIFGFLGLLLEYGHLRGKPQTIFPKLSRPSTTWLSQSLGSSQFWIDFAPILAAAAPRCVPPELNGQAPSSVRVSVPGSGAGLTDRSNNILTLSAKDVDSMRKSHTWFVNQIKHEAPELEYKRGTQGIVTSAGGEYFPTLLVSLQMLRRTGSSLPVEVFLATTEEYESQVCNEVLPALNAKCIILSNIIEQALLPFEISHYQLKAFSMLFSSFENILFLDADNFPVYQPEELFESEPFISQHMVLWPDYWTPTVSPNFYTITGLDADMLDNRPTIEAGQILISKAHHSKTLLLAAYYNTYNDYYYHLMTQGGPGEGDKETFSSAALVLGEQFYTIAQPTHPLGDRHGGAILQPHPTDDFLFQSNPNSGSKSKFNTNYNETRAVRPMFIHASWPPKLNAMRNVREQRQWGSPVISEQLFGTDIEPVVWGIMVEMACREGLEFRDWGEGNKTSLDRDVCEQTKRCFKDMFSTEYVGQEAERMWWSGSEG